MQTLQANRPIHKRSRQSTRYKGSTREQIASCPTGVVANGFLKHQFLPLYQVASNPPKQSVVEPIYLRSVKNLTDHYGLSTMLINGYAYPYNILLSRWDISRQLRTKGRYRELALSDTFEQGVQLSVKEMINTGSTLYYIPLQPLYKGLQDQENLCAKLLMGVCVYLHSKAGVYHYREDESYVCYLYEIMDSWLEDDMGELDKEDYAEQRAMLDETLAVGDKMFRLLRDEQHLLLLTDITQSFVPQSRFEEKCLKLAVDTLSVWENYPNANIYQHLSHIEQDEDDDYYGQGKIRVNEYISFIGETTSCIYDTIINMANDDFNERSGVQDFEATTVFNQSRGQYCDNLSYEVEVLLIIEQLCSLVDEMP